MLMSALDDIAWTLNMRGTDVHCNPVFVAYLLIDEDDTTLFVNPEKLDTETRGYLKTIGVKTADYEQVEQGLKKYKGYNILLDPDETSYTLYKAYGERPKVMLPSPVPAMKAVKNETEIEGYRSAMLKDGVAMVQFLRWLKPAVEKGGVTEISADEKLTALRAQQPLFRDISFDTIAGYGEHGA